MENTIFVNGQMYTTEFETSYEVAHQELKELISAGNRPEDIEIYWYDDENDYHDFVCVDGVWHHRHEIKRMLTNKISI